MRGRVRRRPGPAGGAETGATKTKSPEHVPNLGFRLYEGEKGQVYMRLMSYVRYLNQKGLDATYVDAFGRTQTVKQREDVQLNKFFLPFAGWFLTPKFRYYLYVWSSNASQGDPAQVVGGGNLSYVVQSARDRRRGHHQPAGRAQHRGPVPLLARRRRPPDRGRVLSRLLHQRSSGSRARYPPSSSTWR